VKSALGRIPVGLLAGLVVRQPLTRSVSDIVDNPLKACAYCSSQVSGG
jgi:hypothetical protein